METPEELHPFTELVARFALDDRDQLRGLPIESVGMIATELMVLPPVELAWAVRSLLKLAAHFEIDLDDRESANRIVEATLSAIPRLEAALVDGGPKQTREDEEKVKRFHEFNAAEKPRAAVFDAPAPKASVRLSQILPRAKIG